MNSASGREAEAPGLGTGLGSSSSRETSPGAGQDVPANETHVLLPQERFKKLLAGSFVGGSEDGAAWEGWRAPGSLQEGRRQAQSAGDEPGCSGCREHRAPASPGPAHPGFTDLHPDLHPGLCLPDTAPRAVPAVSVALLQFCCTLPGGCECPAVTHPGLPGLTGEGKAVAKPQQIWHRMWCWL